jgi:hypothetical protein
LNQFFIAVDLKNKSQACGSQLTQEAELREYCSSRSHRESKTPSQPMKSCTNCHPSYAGNTGSGKQDSTGVVAQAEQHLPSKHRVMSSNSSTEKER